MAWRVVVNQENELEHEVLAPVHENLVRWTRGCAV